MTANYCSNCGAETTGGQFCSACGAHVDSAATGGQSAGPAGESPTVTPGAAVATGAAATPRTPPPPNSRTSSGGSGNKVAIVLAAVVVAALLALGTLVATGVQDALVDLAEESNADLIVVATRQVSAMQRWFLGSVADEVIRAAHCPVVTVRSGDDD